MAAALFLATLGISVAQELNFPKTEQQVVEALSFKDGKAVLDGNTYVSQGGRVYKVIGGKRYRMRGLQVIKADGLLPKAGALIQFDFDSARIRPESYQLLDQFGKALSGGLADADIFVMGHTDSVGETDYNQTLSEKRAQAVAAYLINRHHISPTRISATGAGEEMPIASNDTDSGRAKNRRVEFVRVE
jgi:outer membrane protein OmpA-like peptidoglycan-associated protein